MGETALPSELVDVLAFANTLDVEGGTDALGTPAALRGWLEEHQLLPPGAPVGAADVRRAQQLRDALRAVLAGHHEPGPDPAAVEQLNVLAAGVPLRVFFGVDGEVVLEPAAAGVAGALGRLLGVLVTAAAEGTFGRLKICPADDCRWAFYDRSRNASRRWCAMRVCGNRQKTKVYRARQRDD